MEYRHSNNRQCDNFKSLIKGNLKNIKSQHFMSHLCCTLKDEITYGAYMIYSYVFGRCNSPLQKAKAYYNWLPVSLVK